MKTRDVLLGAVILSGSLLVTKAAQVSLTPAFWDWLASAIPDLRQSAGVRFLVAVFGLCSVAWLIAVAVGAWKADRARRAAEHARARAIREARCRQALNAPLYTRNGTGRPAA